MEYRIYCDESVKKGKYVSNFYGGVLVRSKDLWQVEAAIARVCQQHHLNDELKWQRVTSQYLDKYLAVMEVFFDLMEADLVKVRIMFTQNANKPVNLSTRHLEDEYFLLYYQFFKHAFGLTHSNPSDKPIYIRAYFDMLPNKLEKRQTFKEYIKGLQSTRNFQLARIKFRKSDITEIDSRDHRLLQCLDIVLGSMAFRLNDGHKEKVAGTNKRGKRTIAKEKLYKYINGRIRKMLPGFNSDCSTGLRGGFDNQWKHAYRHWLFVPSDVEIDESQYKKGSVPTT